MNYRYDLFKWRREQLGFSFGDVKRKAKLAKGTIIAGEKRTGNPQAKTIKLLSKVYGLDPAAAMNFKLKPEDFHSAVLNGAAG